MRNAELVHYAFMAAAIVLEVAANVFVKYSDGFRRRTAGALGIFCILASFTSLSQAVRGIDLSVAYALWGGMGIVLTAFAGRALFRQRLGRVGWLGVCAIVSGVLLLELS
ncbi:multidrug/spermidine efflux SMR transporter subunit MdtI [Castellaniella defragrans]|jgi:spermidine export protein MdtI|uniref:Spermidine export protein MdtI n=2 Tax=Castellaniella defragrans TaxID=75697 RepID=W8WZQ2_CASD6|nr:multidrug/spermidine efflux SMR transporter subunit MdtI [Castellaniella defragrans]MBB6083082.1 spermidine export protein MdtI [Castellaniella defragrans]CDM25089.1 Spermidine export protein MdtI [Castellaniella defragrans 65Phen]